MENKDSDMTRLKFRPYQTECIEKINKRIDEADAGVFHKDLVALATGLGKTVVFSNIKRPGRTLILSHRDELVRQPQKYYKDTSFGVEKADEYAGNEEVVSASVQTLSHDDRLKRFSPDTFHTIIIDEAHHAAAPTYKKIVEYFSGAKYLLGVTATPKRGDDVRLDDIFDEIIFSKDLYWGIKNGYLCNLKSMQVKGKFSLKGVHKVAGDYNQGEIDKIIRSREVIVTAAKAYIDHCHTPGRHTLVYCVTKEMCLTLLQVIRKMLPEDEREKVAMVTGETSQDERNEILSKFQSGAILGVINCMVLTEGTDLPICDTILNLRITCNNTLYQQIVGRGTRLCDGKKDCLILDLVPEEGANTRKLCTAPTLFGIDPSVVDEKHKKQAEEGEYDLISYCDEISSQLVEYVANVEIALRCVAMYVSAREAIIQKVEDGNLKKLAKYYAETCFQAAEDDDLDFGNIVYEKQADGNRYYRINPNFEDRIYVSKPDVLGNVVMEFHVNAPFMKNSKAIYNGEVKANEAVKLVKEYCSLQKSWYEYSWNRKAQTKWEEEPITEKQKNVVAKAYSKYGMKPETAGKLSKLDGSRLIDFAMQLKEKKDFINTYELKETDSKQKKEKQREKYEATQKEMRINMETGKKQFSLFCERLHEEAGKINAAKIRPRRKIIYYRMHTKTYPKNAHPTRDQLTYAKGLYRIFFDQKGCRFTKTPDFRNMSRGLLAAYIDFMKWAEQNIESGAGYYITRNLEQFMINGRLASNINGIIQLVDEDPARKL